MAATETVAARQRELERQQQAFVRATVVRTERPTSARAGDVAVVDALGEITGFVGGTCVEGSVREFSLQVLESGEPLLLQVRPGEPRKDRIEGAVEVHNPCLSGGSVDVFLEPVVPAPHVVVVGEQPVAQSLARLGAELGYRMELVNGDEWQPVEGTSAVIVAAHGKGEEPALEKALVAGIPYIGLVASDKRGPAVVASLDVDESLKHRVHTPAGLKLGGDSPGEIALGVLAELVQVRATTRGLLGDPELAATGDRGGDQDRTGHEAHAHAEGHEGHGHAHASAPRATRGPATSLDPVCGMTVVAAPPSPHAQHEGRTVWFCADRCRAAFLKEPEAYAVHA